MEEISRGSVVARAGVAATKGIALALDANCAGAIIADEMLISHPDRQPHR